MDESMCGKGASVALDLEEIWATLSNSPALSFVWRNETGWPIEDVTANVDRILGHSKQDLVSGQFSYQTLIHPRDLPRVVSRVNAALDCGAVEIKHEPYRVRNGAGDYRWIHDHTHIRRDESGHAIRFAGIVLDITERVRVESALLERLKELTTLSRVSELFNQDESPLDELLQAIVDVIPPGFQHPAETGARLRQEGVCWKSTDFKSSRCSITAEVKVEGAPNYWLEVHAQVQQPADQYFLLEERDLLQHLAERIGMSLSRRVLTQKLQASESYAHALYTNLPVPTFVWEKQNDHYTLRDFNRAAEQLLTVDLPSYRSASSNEVLAQHPRMLQFIDQAYNHRDHVREVLETDSALVEGSRWLEMEFAYCYPDLVIVQARDITEQKRAEERLHRASRLEAVGQLAGGVAHDFNNLITVISGFTRFALEEFKESDPVHSDLMQVMAAAESAASLTGQLLAFSRKQMLTPRVLNLNAVVQRLQGMLTRVIGEDITLETGLTEDLWTIEADESQIEQVLMNLAVNARDAMPGGGLLSINTRNVTDCQDIHADISMPGPCVALVVEDNGCGMDKETRSRVFEPFFTTKPSGQGTGLGLATVYGIVHQSGGSIIVESDPGAGSRFTVLLPRCMKPEQSRSSSDVTAVVQGHGRVLVVEDSAGLQRLVKRMLGRAGFDVLVADGPADVMEFSESQLASLDLVLTDVIMPQMTGPELAVWLNTKRPELPVVFMTGYTEEEVLRRGVEADLSDFLQKPFTQGDLLEKVTRNLRTRELGA